MKSSAAVAHNALVSSTPVAVSQEAPLTFLDRLCQRNYRRQQEGHRKINQRWSRLLKQS